MKSQFTIGISCIGSGVGQSVINSLRLSSLPLKTIGLGTNPFAYGAYDCDVYDYTSSIYEQRFVENLIEKCQEHKVDLIIPGLDDEALIYAQNFDKFKSAGIRTICSGAELISICRDKDRMSKELSKVADFFVKCYDKNTLEHDIETGDITFPFIVKPRGGFASRGIQIIRDNNDLNKIDEDHIIQELAVPVKSDPNYEYYMNEISKNRNPQVSEISIQVVYNSEGKLLGRMASYNKLNNGVPIEVVPYERDYIWSIINKLTPTLLSMGLRGPLNIQGRLTENGLKLFEMNPRFTGITGLRALMGFNEVEACVKEWLGIDKGKNKLRLNYNRFGSRQTADKSICFDRNQEVAQLSQTLNENPLKQVKTVLLTGATGNLGQELSKLISSKAENYELVTLGREKKRSETILGDYSDRHFSYKDLEQGLLSLGNVDVLIHAGFARPHCTNIEIAQSLHLTGEIFTRAVLHQVPLIINISSQSVYGQASEPLWTEQTQPSPETQYAQAKYASEILLESLGKGNPLTKFTSIRLAALAGGIDIVNGRNDFMSKMVVQALQGSDLIIYGAEQKMERMDVRDAAASIFQICKQNLSELKPVYNLGTNKTYTLKYIAKKILDISKDYTKKNGSKIILETPNHAINNFGLDSTAFFTDFKWEPKYSIDDIVMSLIHNYKCKNNKVNEL